jgi:hypothetical protein
LYTLYTKYTGGDEMKYTTKKILEVFPELEQYLLGNENVDHEVLSNMDSVIQTLLLLGMFFENPKQGHFDVGSPI